MIEKNSCTQLKYECRSKLFLFKQDFTPNLISFIISEDHCCTILLILLLYISYHYQYYSEVGIYKYCDFGNFQALFETGLGSCLQNSWNRRKGNNIWLQVDVIEGWWLISWNKTQTTTSCWFWCVKMKSKEKPDYQHEKLSGPSNGIMCGELNKLLKC